MLITAYPHWIHDECQKLAKSCAEIANVIDGCRYVAVSVPTDDALIPAIRHNKKIPIASTNIFSVLQNLRT